MPVKNAKRPLRVLITGAGKGVGFACACAFAHRGAELILTDSDPEALTRASDFVDGFSRFCDVLSETSVAIFAEHFAQDFGSFDVLINAAGEGYVRSLGMVRMSSALLPVLRRGEGERLIVNVAPCCQDGDDQGLFRHAASRIGFDQLSEALNAQTRGSMIDVVAVHPAPKPSPVGGGTLYGFNVLADKIVAMVKAKRPDWKARASTARKRA